jgi:hypothetical protein
MRPILTSGLHNRLPRVSIRLAVSAILVTSAPALRAQDAYSPKFTVFAGAGINATQQNSRGAIQAGASFDEAPPGSWGGFSFEGGYLGPWAHFRAGSAFTSLDYMAAWSFGQKAKGRTEVGSCFHLPLLGTRGFLVPAMRSILAADSITGSVTLAPFEGRFVITTHSQHRISTTLRCGSGS